MKEIALDTNIAVDLLNGKPEVIEKLRQFDMIYLPATVCGELMFGAKNSGKRKDNIANFRSFISNCEALEINSLVAEEYSDIRIEMKKKGRPIPENDIWIAAICVSNGVSLMTRDQHFENIDQLRIERF